MRVKEEAKERSKERMSEEDRGEVGEKRRSTHLFVTQEEGKK
jgi:hypothetical protein